jgi:hypothetical protein
MSAKNNHKKNQSTDKDLLYALKIVIFFILGCLWIQVGGEGGVPIPIGLIFGLVLTTHEHFIIDRKIEYLVLLIAAVLSFVEPIGFVLNIG